MELSLDLTQRYTYADYLTWLDDKRRELVSGIIKLMSPAPKMKHQSISRRLLVKIDRIIRRNRGKCQVFHAPFDVRLPANGETADNKIYSVVQPDICIICDPQKLDERGCLGAPDFVAEILSYSSAAYDTTTKFALYERSGVREYWIVYPDECIDVFLLQDDGKYSAATRYESGNVPVFILGNEEVDLEEILWSN